MNYSERNRKVAISRWKKVHELELSRIKNTQEIIRHKALICGFLAGDGSVQERKRKTFSYCQVDFFADDKKMLNDYVYSIKEVYDKTPTIKNENQFITARLSSKTVVQDLKKIASFGIKTWLPPESLFSIKGTKENWLRGFFSAEGYVEPNAIKIQTVNEAGMTKVVEMLNDLGIDNKQYEYQPKDINHSKVHIIRITKKEALERFYNKVGFSHYKKATVLKKALGL